jgi:hypothetical protein
VARRVCAMHRLRMVRKAVEGGLVGDVECNARSEQKSCDTHEVRVATVTYVNDPTRSPTEL